MQFQTLPDDILVQILGLLIPPNMVHIEWKDQLYLLSVCRRLRQLALPLLYRYAFACVGFEPQPTAVLTNTDLLSASNETDCIMDITIRNGSSASMATIMDVLKNRSNLGSRVTNLRIHFFGHSTAPIEQTMDDKAKLLADTITLFPAITELAIGGSTAKALIQHYASRLQKLHYSQNEVIPELLQLKQLTDLNVMMYPTKRLLLPQINIHIIQRITIFMLQPDCTWGLFGATGSSRVEVPNLYELKLGYVGNSDNRDFVVSMMNSCQLLFPQLKSLELSGDADYFPLLNSAILPPKMGKIEITAKPSTYLTFKNAVFPSAKWQKYCVIGVDNVEAAMFFPAFNHAIQRSHHSKSTTIYLGNSIKSFTAKDLCCSNLTRLQVSIPTDPNEVVDVLRRFPQLIWVSLIIYSNENNQYFDTALSGQPVVPLNTSLEELFLDDSSPGRPSRLQTDILKYLMMRLPALKKVGSWNLETKKLKEFALEHVPKYPHLAIIKFG